MNDEDKSKSQLMTEALHQAGMALSSTLDFDIVLDRLLDWIVQVVPYDVAHVTLIEDGAGRLVCSRGYEQLVKPDSSFELSQITKFHRLLDGREPVVISDTAAYSEWVTSGAADYIRSWLSVPIKVRDQVIAFIGVGKAEPGFYRPEHSEHLETFAGQAAIALENARLFEQTQATLTQTEVLYRAARSLIATDSLADVLQAVVDGVAEALIADRVLLYTLDMENQEIVHFVKGGPGAGLVSKASFEALWSGLTGWVLHELKPALSPKGFPDSRESLEAQRHRLQAGIGAMLVVPLSHRGKLLGSMMVINRIEDPDFTLRELELTVTMANQAAVAIEQARLFDETRRWAQQLTILNELAREMTGLLEVRDLCTTVIERLRKTFGYFDVSVFTVDSTAQQVVLEAVTGTYASVLVAGEYRQNFGQGVIGRVAETGQTILVNDPRLYPEFVFLQGMNVRSELAIPLKIGKRIIGVLNVESDQFNAFDKRDESALTTVADQLAVAIEKARLFNETRQRAEQLEALYQVSQDLIALRELDVLLTQIVERAIQLLGGDAGGVFLHRPERHGLELVVAIGKWFDRVGTIQARGEGLSGKIWATGKPMIIDDYQNWPGKSSQWLDLSGAVLGVPIQAGDQFLGVLVHVGSGRAGYTSEDATLLGQFAVQAAIAIENVRLYQETQQQARQVQQILDTIQDGILLLDREHRVKLANPAAQVYLVALAGVGIGEIVTHLGEKSLPELLIPSKNHHWHEVSVSTPVYRVFEIAARPMKAESEREGWVMVLRDVTEEREVQKRIQQKERLAAVGQLAAGIAHDFNNILTSIIGFTELAQIHPDVPGAVKKDLNRIIHQSQRAANLVRQILDFGRQSIIERRPLDLVPFVKETVKLLERTIPEDIHIILSVEPGNYLVKADPAQMQQVLTNLALNARDAMPAGGTLEIRFSSLSLNFDQHPPCPGMLPGNWLALSVSDTGVGISSELLPHIYEPFFTTKEVGEGSGLGLAQVYGIIRQHEGYINVESEVDQGTTFTCYLPVLASSPQTLNFNELAPEDISPGAGQTLLLVEDEPAVLEVTQAMLEHLGYRVLTATNGLEALTAYESQKDEIALVLTDITMPELGGIALIQALKEKNSEIKVVALTGYPLEAEIKEMLAEGIVAWLPKPLSLEQLAQIINHLLKENSSELEYLN